MNGVEIRMRFQRINPALIDVRLFDIRVSVLLIILSYRGLKDVCVYSYPISDLTIYFFVTGLVTSKN